MGATRVTSREHPGHYLLVQGTGVPGTGDGEGDPRGLDVHEQPVSVERRTRELVPGHRRRRAGDGPRPDVGGEVEELAAVVDAPQERLAGPIGVLTEQDPAS